jgi:hypothetical protein
LSFFVCNLGLNSFVNPLHLSQWVGIESVAVENRFPTVDQHPELRAPVADVIVAHGFVADELCDACNGVAEDRAANVANVHRLGDVRRGEVDDDFFRVRGCGDAEPFRIGGKRGGALFEPFAFQPEIDEPRACDLRRLAHFGDVEFFNDLLRKLAGICFCLLGEQHRDIGLIVAEACVGCGRDLRLDGDARRERDAQLCREKRLHCFHHRSGLCAAGAFKNGEDFLRRGCGGEAVANSAIV